MIIIEFLYMHYKKRIVQLKLPIYCLQVFIYFLSIMLIDVSTTDYAVFKIFIDILNAISSLYTLFDLIFTFYQLRLKHLGSVWVYFDFFYVVTNGILSSNNIVSYFAGKSFILISRLRVIGSILSIIIFVKAVYFMQLIDAIAPIIRILQRMLADIKVFVLLMLAMIFSFTFSFYLVGINQLYHDNFGVNDPTEN